MLYEFAYTTHIFHCELSQRSKYFMNNSLYNRGKLKLMIAVIAAITVLSFAPQPAAALDIMPVDQVKEGMKGYGKTVFAGDRISRFPVKVRGVVPGSGMSGEPLILVELTGREVERYGGVSMGMSGSPIYVNNKLIGALSLAFPLSDHSLGGVTPIEVMLEASKYDTKTGPGSEQGKIPLEKPLRVAGKTYKWIQHGVADSMEPGVLYARPALAPVAVGGLSDRAMGLMKRQFAQNGIEIRPIKKLQKGTAKSDGIIGPGSALEPGSSVAVQLIRGDIDFSAVGTVTAIEDGRVLLFGHPFFRKGPVEYLLADAYVNAIVTSTDVPYKITTTGLLRGMVVQDRGSALVGRLDSYPLLVPVKVNVTDADIGRKKTVAVKIVRDPDFIVNLILMTALEAIDNSIDRIGRGTARMRFNLRASGHDGTVKMENMFYDRYDIAIRSLSDLVDALMLFSENRFFDSMVTGLEINLDIDSSNSVASIEKVEIAERIENPADEAARTAAEQRAQAKGKTAETESAKGDTKETAPEETTEETSAKTKVSIEKTELESIEGKTDEEKDFDDFLDNIFSTKAKNKKGNDKKEEFPRVMRGEKLKLSVRVRPYKEDTVGENLFLKVPQNIALGNAVIKVFSGKPEPTMSAGVFNIDISADNPEDREQAENNTYDEEEKEESFDDVLNDFLDRDLNNELVATIMPVGFNTDDNEKADKEKTRNYTANEGKAKKRTDWVLNGSAVMKVKVVDEDGRSFKEIRIKKSKINALRVE